MATYTDKAKDVIEEGADAAEKTIMTTANKATDVARRAKGVAEDAIDNGRDTLEGALSSTKDMVRSNPIASVAIVAAVAYLWGRMKK